MPSEMGPERWARVRKIVDEALERDSREWSKFLGWACAGDEPLRKEVESLLAERGRTGILDQTRATEPSTISRSLEPGDVLAGRFRIVRRLGRGGMGDVYEGEDLNLGGRVALKTIRPDIASNAQATARFKREVQTAKQVTHPNVCRIYDLHITPGNAASGEPGMMFLTMEMLQGENLADRLSRGRMSTQEAGPLVLQMAAALDAAHEVGIVHRDFKPANVMLTPTGKGNGIRVVVTDFGLARSMEDTAGNVTMVGHIVGTPAYMSPEQLTLGTLTPATDIFALGIVMYEMVAGRRPFPEAAYLRPKAPSPRQFVPDLDPQWESAILRCLKQNSEERFQTAADLIAALSAPAVQGGGARAEESLPTRQTVPPVAVVMPTVPVTPVAPAAPTVQITTIAPPSLRKTGMWLASGVAACLLLAAIVWILFFRSHQPAAPDSHQSPAPGPARAGSLGEVRTNAKDGLPYVWIPAGTFRMGCSPGDAACAADEKPVHEVGISQGFWMGQTEVTAGAYQRYTRAAGTGRGDLPAVSVTWQEAAGYCEWAGLRLPTEAEWEFAARGGNVRSRYAGLDAIAWDVDNSGNAPQPVAKKKPNGYGLYDTLGNVWEWTADFYSSSYYQANSGADPKGPAGGAGHVLRGGAWDMRADGIRVSARAQGAPENHASDVGFRCVGELP